MSEPLPQDVEWQKALLDSLNIGGVWRIPRTGAVFSKIARDMVFIEERGTSKELLDLCIKHIEAAGYRVANA